MNKKDPNAMSGEPDFSPRMPNEEISEVGEACHTILAISVRNPGWLPDPSIQMLRALRDSCEDELSGQLRQIENEHREQERDGTGDSD